MQVLQIRRTDIADDLLLDVFTANMYLHTQCITWILQYLSIPLSSPQQSGLLCLLAVRIQDILNIVTTIKCTHSARTQQGQTHIIFPTIKCKYCIVRATVDAHTHMCREKKKRVFVLKKIVSGHESNVSYRPYSSISPIDIAYKHKSVHFLYQIFCYGIESVWVLFSCFLYMV